MRIANRKESLPRVIARGIRVARAGPNFLQEVGIGHTSREIRVQTQKLSAQKLSLVEPSLFEITGGHNNAEAGLRFADWNQPRPMIL
jgi:hypothetical protein